MQVKREIELLAPGGDIDAIKAAILAGADAIYCGLDRFNARNRAANITFNDLQGILHLAHKNSCEIFLTLNILIVENEIPSLIALLNKLINTSIDGIIVQDLGLFYLLSNYFQGLKIHASTQLTTHNEGQIRFLSKLNSRRINLSRELNIQEIKALTAVAHQYDILTEVFVHGSYCISFSGICYMSSVQGGNSGNRGRCSQPCRDRYHTTQEGKEYPLNLKDNSAWFDLQELSDAGVDSLKIEGRIKKSDYVYTVVDSWRKRLHGFYHRNEIVDDNGDLYKVFNRDFSNGFLKGVIHRDMFISNPRNHSVQHLAEVHTSGTGSSIENDQIAFYEEKEAIKAFIANKIQQINASRVPVIVTLSGEAGAPLKVTVDTPDSSFVVLSEVHLEKFGTEALNYEMAIKRFKAINNTQYYIEELRFDNFQNDVYLPFKELTSLKNKILFILNGSKAMIPPIGTPMLVRPVRKAINPHLSVLISSEKDLHLCDNTTADIYFELPGCLKDGCSELIELFIKNKRLNPWFQSVIIGEDYTAAVEFLQKVQPKLIVTNNTGIAFEASRIGIDWIAGPFLNMVNSFSLKCLKDYLNCSGAFISNEINKVQIQGIQPPEDFKLYYSIYHPIVLMTSRQCLFQQVTGCEKNKIDDSCISCENSSSITNLKGETFMIDKTRGNYHNIFNELNFLNTDIVTDIPDVFSGFLIDLRDIKSGTRNVMDKSGMIQLFESLLNGDPGSKDRLNQILHSSTNVQYKKGI